MPDESRLRSIRNQAQGGREDLREAEERLKEELDADRLSLKVESGLTRAVVTWEEDDD